MNKEQMTKEQMQCVKLKLKVKQLKQDLEHEKKQRSYLQQDADDREELIGNAEGSIMDVIETHIPEYMIDSVKFELADIWLTQCVQAMEDSETWAELRLERDPKQRRHYSAVRDLCEAFIREFDRFETGFATSVFDPGFSHELRQTKP